MMADRRLGRGLKGMNKSNLVEIENAVWPIIEREATLFQTEIAYNRHKSQLESDLKQRKAQLQEEIARLEGGTEEGTEAVLADCVTVEEL